MKSDQNTHIDPSEPTFEPTSPASPTTFAALSQALAHAITTGTLAAVNAAQPRQVSYQEMVARSSNNPTRAERLTRRYFQNGFDLSRAFAVLSDHEIELLERLTPGRGLVNGLVTITEEQPGGRGAEKIVRITYANATVDQRGTMKNEVRNLAELLERCIADAKPTATDGSARS